MTLKNFPVRTASIALLAGLALGGCGYGYGGFGTGGVSVGYGTGYGSYSGNPYWGWNDGYYYPGRGYYVYDSYRRPIRWSRDQQRYWTSRQSYWRERGQRRQFRENWSDFDRNRSRQNRH
ncbi:MAG: hypothetical protein V4696_12930 [Pseudomonadota bacterium]